MGTSQAKKFNFAFVLFVSFVVEISSQK